MTNIELELARLAKTAIKTYLDNDVDWEQRTFDLATKIYLKGKGGLKSAQASIDEAADFVTCYRKRNNM